jgi:hypothetical protein
LVTTFRQSLAFLLLAPFLHSFRPRSYPWLRKGLGVQMLTAIVLMASMATSQANADRESEAGIQTMLNEESPDVFLAKATLQQYLSRVVRKDWDGARRLTHPKTLQLISQMKRRTGAETHNLAPWADRETQLKTFRFVESRQIAPGIVAVQVGEDNFHRAENGMSSDDAATYILFKSRGAFLLGDKKASVEISEISAESVRLGYPGFVDVQVQAQARRDAGLHEGRHR